MLSVAMAEDTTYTIYTIYDIIFLVVRVFADPFSPAEVYYHIGWGYRSLKPLHQGGFC